MRTRSVNIVNTLGEHQASNTTATEERRELEYLWVLKKHHERLLLIEYKLKKILGIRETPEMVKKVVRFVTKFFR